MLQMHEHHLGNGAWANTQRERENIQSSNVVDYTNFALHL